MVDQLSFEFVAFSSASFAAPTELPVRNATRTASVASGRSSLSDRADATTDAASKPVQRPTTLVLVRFGSSEGFSA
jgi:hypothetical protein